MANKEKITILIGILMLAFFTQIVSADQFDGNNPVIISSISTTKLSSTIDMTGLYTNGTIVSGSTPDTFYIVDDNNDRIWTTNNSFDNKTNFKTLSTNIGLPTELTSNGSDFWLSETNEIFHLNSTFDILENFTYNDDPLTMNRSNIFRIDTNNVKIIVFNLSMSNTYNITCVTAGDCDTVQGMTTIDGSNFWLLDSNRIVKINYTGGTVATRNVSNIGDGSTLNMRAITTTDGNNLWIAHSNDIIYHIQYNDTISPTLNITFPQNITYDSTITALNYTVSDDGILSSCWYSLNNGQTNTTITCGNNVTGLNSGEGSFTWTIYANDTYNNRANFSRNFIVDSTFPLISFGVGTEDDGSNISRTNIYVNVSVTETNEANITFLLYNTTSQVNSTTYTTSVRTINWTNLADGNYTFNVTIRDSLNNQNTTSSRKVIIDSTFPLISFVSPTENTGTNFSRNYIIANVTITEVNFKNITFLLYNSTSQVNKTTYSSQTLFINWSGLPNQNYTYNVSVTDLVNNINTTETRRIKLDTLNPEVTIVNPLNGSYYTTSSIVFNVTLNEDGFVQYTLNDGVSNITMSSTNLRDYNATNTSIADGQYTFKVYSNDTAGNRNDTTSTIFTIDTTKPLIVINYPSNNSNFSTTSVQVNFTATETNLQVCKSSKDSGATNTTRSCSTGVVSNFTDTYSEGLNTVFVYVNDSAGNINQSLVTFRVDTTAPSLNIISPLSSEAFSFNNSINLNYSVSDSGVGLSSCWFNLDNGANTTISNCLNTTFNTSEGSHTVYLFSNDSINNIASTSRVFSVQLNAPAITLNSPLNDTYFNRSDNIYLNYTATDGNGISSCQVWHDINGSFVNNQTNNGVTSGQMNYTIFNISQDNPYKWNIFCNDTTNQGTFALNNFTFTIDTTFPVIPSSSIDITTPVGGQSITINVTSFTEINCNNSFYSVYDSSGAIENGISNKSLTSCTFLNDTFDVNDVPANTYNLTIYMRDKAGNENSTTKQFSTIATGGGATGGGGAVTTIQEVPVIALQETNTSQLYSELQRAIIYATINNYCSNKLEDEPLAIVDLSETCKLTINDIQPISQILKSFGLTVTDSDLRLFIELYTDRKFVQAYASKLDVERYDLFSVILGPGVELWLLNPSSLSKYFTFFETSGNSTTLPFTFSSNKNLKSCEVISNTPNIKCTITSNLTFKTELFIENTNFLSKTFTGTILVSNEQLEQKRVSLTFRTINYGNSTAIGIGITSLVLISLSIFIYTKRRRQKFSKQIQEFISLK